MGSFQKLARLQGQTSTNKRNVCQCELKRVFLILVCQTAKMVVESWVEFVSILV